MFKWFWKKMKSEEGFTLVEQLVVVAIIGILTGVAVPTYSGFQARARWSATQSELQAVRMAWTFYEVESGGSLDDVGGLYDFLEGDLYWDAPIYTFMGSFNLYGSGGNSSISDNPVYIFAAPTGDDAGNRVEAFITKGSVSQDPPSTE